MNSYVMGLDLRVFTLPLLARLRRDGYVADRDVIRIATARENAGYNASPAERELSLLLQEQEEEARTLLLGVDSDRLTLQEERALLWIKLKALRSQAHQIEGYQFEFEELLDRYDSRDDYARMRFFVGHRGAKEPYLNRIDATLESVREDINAAAARRS